MRTGLALPGSHTLLFRQALPALLAMARGFAGAGLRVCGIFRVSRLGGFGEPVRRAGKACLIAKESRIHADWARPSWLAHFALQAGLTCTVGDGAAFCWSRSGECAG